jgi:hypothetical protein
VDAAHLLSRIAEALDRHRLEAVLIGNAGAALQGAPVTTLDFDFMFRNTPSNLKKLNAVAADLGAKLYMPYELGAGMLRIQNEDYRLLVDFLPSVAGVRSFEGLRKRAKRVQFGKGGILVADLADIIKSKRAANRPKDKAVLGILEETLEEASRNAEGNTGRAQKGK